MKLKIVRSPVVFLCGLCLLPFVATAAETNLFDPPALYLTWQHDPSTTMTVHWHTTNRAEAALQFRAAGEKSWREAKGSSVPMPEAKSERTIHTVEISGLAPQSDYVMRFGEQSKEFKFRTMPKDLSKPIRFIEGGDVYHQRQWMDQMNELAAKLDPAFVVIGGDLAYANNKTSKVEMVNRWYDYFDSWKKKAVAPDGRLIPLLVTLGNHEVKGFWGQPPEKAVGFYALFSMPGSQGYNVVDFGDYLSVLLLDSGLTHPVKGAQTEWLKQTLERRRAVPHIFPVYHVPAYPSCRPDEGGENGDITMEIRKTWVPLFEQAGVKISFEHHDHAFKRTHPIRAGKKDPDGIVFLGDGAWGVNLRQTHPIEQTWYLAKAGAVRHFFVVTISSAERKIEAVNDKGDVFDTVIQPVKR